jgi:DNA replication protein DnaC
VPQDVRQRLRLPAKYAMATLAPEVRDTYNEELYQGVTRYLAAFPAIHTAGVGPLLAGPPHSGTSWAAAALANEIVLRSQANRFADIQVSWLSCFWVLRLIQDARDLSRTDTYVGLRDAMLKNDLVVVDDLLAAAEVPGGVPFIHTVFAYRYDHNLPTITTVTTSASSPFPEIAKVYGRNFRDRLVETTDAYLVRVRPA